MKKIKVAVVGLGNIAYSHILSFAKNESVELYAFCSRNKDNLRSYGEKYSVTNLYTDIDRMLSELPELDCVSICTPNGLHYQNTLAALRAGKHVLCEKPLALTEAEALEMKNAADESGKLLMVGFMRRFGDDSQLIKNSIAKGDFGEVYYAKATFLRRNGFPGGWFGDKSLSGGGPLIDLGVHIIDLTRYILGNPRPVSVYGAAFDMLGKRADVSEEGTCTPRGGSDVFDVEDLASALIRYDNGTVVSIEAAHNLNISQDEMKIEFFGSKAGAQLYPKLEIYSSENGHLTTREFDPSISTDFSTLFDKEVDHFIDCVANGKECMSPADDGVMLMKIIDAIYESAKTGHEVLI